MKLNDLDKTLTEAPLGGPAGFGARAKAKLQKNIPFAKQKRRQGSVKDRVFKKAKQIKDDLMAWKAEAFASGKGIKQPLNMKQFLDWMTKSTEYGEAVVIAAKEIHPNLFQDKQTKPESKPKPEPEKYSDEELAKIKAKYKSDAVKAGAETEKNIEDEGKRDLTASKEDDKEPKVDTSASIYEARLKALLEDENEPKVDTSLASSADGTISNDPLNDNQVDTLIVRAIEKHAQLVSGAPVPGKKEAEAKEKPKSRSEKRAEKHVAGSQTSAVQTDESDTFTIDNGYKRPLEVILKKVYSGDEFDKNDKKDAQRIYKSI